ncbi:MAG: helical backbone metal receptor [Saprospiraceae bacterium]|nr:helical backbone metal receptor [Saprospiraceae bacterium]
MAVFHDQMGRKTELPHVPRRIVSTVPSQTEVLYDLGLEEEVVAITKYCIHPAQWQDSKVIIGGTKNIDVDHIRTLEPDLIISNKEENIKEKIDDLAKDFPVWISDVKDHSSATSMIRSIGEMTERKKEAERWITEIENEKEKISKRHLGRALYFIWKGPWMASGGDTFINSMMEIAGFENVLMDQKRYPVLREPEISEIKVDHVLLSSEPYPFKEKHLDEVSKLFPAAEVSIVNGELFSWYGTRMKKAYRYFREFQTAF